MTRTHHDQEGTRASLKHPDVPGDSRQFDEPGLALVLRLAGRLRCGELDIRLPDGTVRRCRGAEPGPCAVIALNSSRVARRYLTAGGVGFAESYIDGDWDTPDL